MPLCGANKGKSNWGKLDVGKKVNLHKNLKKRKRSGGEGRGLHINPLNLDSRGLRGHVKIRAQKGGEGKTVSPASKERKKNLILGGGDREKESTRQRSPSTRSHSGNGRS